MEKALELGKISATIETRRLIQASAQQGINGYLLTEDFLERIN